MTTPDFTSGQYLRTLQIVHLALFGGQVMFIAIVVWLNMSGMTENQVPDIEPVFRVLVPLFAVSGLAVSILITRRRLEKVRREEGLKTRLEGYRSTFVVKAALMEGCGMFAIVAYLLTGSILFAGIAAGIALIFLTIRPTVGTITNDLALNTQERSVLQTVDSVVWN